MKGDQGHLNQITKISHGVPTLEGATKRPQQCANNAH